MCSIIVLAFVAVCTKQAHAINFKIQPKENLCFHEITHKGNKVLAFFDVLSWGYGAYIYMTVTSPGGHELKKFDAESEGRIDFIATEDGEHSFCFQNAQTETEISFWVNTESDSALTDVAKEEHVNDMVYNIEKLNSLVSAARVDLEAFKAREHFHRKIADKNRRRVTFWAFVECLLILGVAGVQIMRIRNFFEYKRMV